MAEVQILPLPPLFVLSTAMTKALIRFDTPPPTGSWKTLVTFHGPWQRQWRATLKVLESTACGHIVEMESTDAPAFPRGDEAIEILSGTIGIVSSIGRGHIIER